MNARHALSLLLLLPALPACSGAPDEGAASSEALKTTTPSSFYATYMPTGAATPSSMMLDAHGKVSLTVKDQGQNGGCWAFANVAVIESEYISRLGYPAATFALSDQYDIFNAERGGWGEIDLAGPPGPYTPGIGNFELIAHSGLPPAASYPVDLQRPWVAFPRVVGPMYAAANPQSFPSALSTYAKTGDADPNWISALIDYAIKTPLANDLTRYNGATLAPASVHEQAIYAPTSASWISAANNYATGGANNCNDPNSKGDTSVNCKNVYPFEEVLSQGHAIQITVNNPPDEWLQDPTTKVFNYNAAAGLKPHGLALVGYDRQRQVFRFKNSWGAKWNGDGFGFMSYYLFSKVVTGQHAASFVTGVRNPAPLGLGGGAFMGFWNARINGQKGVAALHYTFGHQITINSTATPLVDMFQTSAGRTLQLRPVSGTASSTKISFNGTAAMSQLYPLANPFTLTRNIGSLTATYTDLTNGETETWYKCDPTGARYATAPSTYADAASDPYVLPPCGDTAWEELPVATCNGGDVAVPAAVIQYHTATTPAATRTANICIGISNSVPQCTNGQSLQLDSGASYYAGAGPYQSEADICAKPYTSSAPPTSCANTPISILGTSGFVDTIVDSSQNYRVGFSTYYQPGPDHCVGPVYDVTYQCPWGAAMQSNGDCLVQTPPSVGVFWNQDYGYPAVSPPRLGDWSPGNYKGECALGRPINGVSRAVNGVQSHAIECGPQTIATDPTGAQCLVRLALNSDNRGTNDNGTDWDPGAYKTECAANEYVAGISQAANGQVRGILCCPGTVAHNNCDTQVFYNNDSPAFSGADWDPGYYKGQCPSGQYVAGISTPAFSSVGATGAAHAVLCCAP
jgi:hypothetical protein